MRRHQAYTPAGPTSLAPDNPETRRGNHMAEKKTVGSVTYTQTDKEYFQKRGLRRYARVWSLWALGVGAVISGHYSGWNFGLQYGFGGMLIALFVIAAMYWGLISASPRCRRRCPTRVPRIRSRAARSGPGAESSPDSPKASSTY
jgi:hypothetical protein